MKTSILTLAILSLGFSSMNAQLKLQKDNIDDIVRNMNLQ